MPKQTEEGDFPRGGAKQKGKKRKLQNTEKDLFKTGNEESKKKRSSSETLTPKKGSKEKKNKQKKKQKDNENNQDKKNVSQSLPKTPNNKDNKTPEKKNDSQTKSKKKKKGKNNSKVQMKSKVDGESNDKSQSGNKKKKRRNRKKKSGNKKSEKVDHDKKESLGRVEKLHFARVQVGMHILGCVARVDEYSLTFDLPGGLQGEVPITAVSDTYTDQLKRLASRDSDEEEDSEEGAVVPLSAMYQPGMIFPCRVAAIKIRSGSKKKIFLSMNPSVVNKDLVKSHIQEGLVLCGSVTGCEEHGYTLEVGVAGTRVFLPDKHAHKYISKVNNDSPIHVGQVLRCHVLSIQGNMVTVGVNPHKMAKVKMPKDIELDSNTLQSGLQVIGTVKEVLKDGLSVLFNSKVGYVHRTHTTQYKHKKSFSPGDQVSATLLYTLNDNSIIYLSLLPHLAGSICREVYETLSALADRKTVHQVSALDALKKAVYFNMEGGLKALATLSNLVQVCDYKTPLHKTFKFGTKHSCKVIGFNLVDHFLLVRLHKPGSESDSEDTNTVASKKKKTKEKENTASESKSAKKRKLENDKETETPKSEKKAKKSGKAEQVDSEKSEKRKKKLKEEESMKEDTELSSAKKRGAVKNDEETSDMPLSSKKKKKKADSDVEMEEDVSLSAKKKKKMKNEEIPSKRKEISEISQSSKKAKDESDESESSEDDSESDSEDSDSDADFPSSSNKVKTCLFGDTKKVSQKQKKDESEESSDSDSDLDDSDSDSSDSDSDEDLTPAAKKKKGQEKVKKPVEVETPSKKKKGERTPGKKSPEETDSGVEVNKLSDSDDEGDLKVPKVGKNPARLSLSTGFSWSEDFCTPGTPDSDDSSDEDTEEQKVAKKTGSELRRERMEEEKAIFAYERQQLEGGQVPLTSEDFDRLTLQSPNSSLVWTRYMAHHLETVEIDKARAVAERALKTISFREEQEKLNVWGAYLNVENMYGGAESVKAVFDRAVQQNEPIRVYKQMVQIYIGSDKMEEAEKLYNVMCKKFSQDKSVWTGFGQFFFRNKRVEPARKLLQRCLKCLEDREHIEMISKFAQLEYKYGDSQRGCTMFENILTNYPKRTDLWSVYIDMVVKAGKLDDARSLFERVIHMKMSSKKMQFFFKKYLEFEKKHGDSKLVEKVKQKAVDYVEAQGFTEAD